MASTTAPARKTAVANQTDQASLKAVRAFMTACLDDGS
jgi:hypothetical protein